MKLQTFLIVPCISMLLAGCGDNYSHNKFVGKYGSTYIGINNHLWVHFDSNKTGWLKNNGVYAEFTYEIYDTVIVKTSWIEESGKKYEISGKFYKDGFAKYYYVTSLDASLHYFRD